MFPISHFESSKENNFKDQLSIIQDSVTHQLAEVFIYYHVTSSSKHFFKLFPRNQLPRLFRINICTYFIRTCYQHLQAHKDAHLEA